MILLHIIFFCKTRNREREKKKNTPEKLKIHLPRARYKRDTNKMLKGIFTPPQDEEHIDRDALREESLDTQEGDDGSVPVVVESEQQHEQQKKREKREEGKTSIELFLAQNKSLSEMKVERDGQAGIMLWVNVGIFCFLLFSPIIALIPTMSNAAFMAIELSLIILIGWSKN